ncbi:MAG: hypothetical protein LQ340_000303 [Diploschistes diacapsis]|nr:MAG: hypothetical protein LQ340_000303 [Diploschistes diacapsis]
MSSGGATNWKTNVNRAKTKRWVEAKSYTYDGDDWGEADEYGEYDGGYDDEPEPPPKPTGLRQAGKGAAGMSNVPPQQVQPFPPQQIQDTRPLGQPEPPFQQSDRQRTNSFGRGDDRRGFSGPSNPSFTQPLVDRGRATPFPTPNRPRAPSDAHGMQQQAQPSFEQAPSTSGQGIPNRAPWSDSSRSQSMTSSSAANPQQLEFSYPSAAPQPLQARPPRKSSLSQSDRGQPGSIAPPQTNMPLGGSQTHGTSQQNVSTPTIIRPADIYARMKGKKERERLSQESSRPSMDSIQAPEPSPANASDNERKQKKQGLESVAERKSEHGIEGLLVATNTKPSIKPAGPKDSLVLPEIGGFEGFGQGFGDSFMSLPGDTEAGEGRTESLSVSGGAEVKAGPAKIEPVSQTPIEFDTIPEALAKPSQPTRAEPAEPDSKITNPSPNSSLHHEPSLGFRSAVNQAFDSQIPPTPSSASGSNLDRSNSESTNDISPIISRNTSGAVAPPKKDIPSITSIPEEPPTTPRPGIAVASWAVVGERTASRESLQALKQGHRRNISTPSPDNSPARTPNVEVNRQLQSPQEAELETITPTTASYNTNSTSNRVAHEEPNSPSRAGSPTKGRVRDLVDKLDSASNSRKGSESSLREKADVSQRPNLDTQQSFRPQLPGAWPSYLSNVPGQQPKHESETTTPGANDPFAAAAAARTALAGALATAVGFMPEPNDNDGQPTAKLEEPRSIPTKGSAMRPEAQRLPLPRSESDAPSSIVPTPTYMKSETSDREGNEEYFAPITPLNQRAKQGNLKDLPQLEKTRAYDDMSTESSPNDLESDRLRKELVRELSPQVESFNQVSESPVHNQDSPSQARAHESMFLPSEYESYWNAAPEGGESSRKASELGSLPAGSPPVQKSQFQPAQNTSHPMQPHPQPLHQRQFSGNQGHQAVPNEVQSRKDQPEDASSYSSQTGETLMPQQPRRMSHKFSWEGPAEATSQNNPSQASDTAANNLRNEITAESPLPRPPVAVAHEHTPSSSSMPDLNKQLPQGPAESAYDVPGQRDSFRSEYPAFVEPSQETVPSETPPQSSQQAKIPAFREIMAIKDVDERLRTYDATRTQFANMNTGLADWIQATISTLPEHSDLIRNGGCFGPNARPIQASSNPNSGSQRPLQSQVLKSSFPPGAGKTTSQKGKDLIHTAGVFGGKAGSATKGFFSKGRSKLRGLGGDKVD